MSDYYIRSTCRKFIYGYQEVWDASAPVVGFVMMRVPDSTKTPDNLTVPHLREKAHHMQGGGVFILFVDPNVRAAPHHTQAVEFDKAVVADYARQQLEECYPVVATWRRDTKHTQWYLDIVESSGMHRTLHLFGRYKDGNLHTVPHIRNRTITTPWRF